MLQQLRLLGSAAAPGAPPRTLGWPGPGALFALVLVDAALMWQRSKRVSPEP